MKNQEDIEKFCSYFEKQVKEIIKIENPLFIKILLTTIIDPLARVYSRGNIGNRKRFRNIIMDCSNWNDCERISIPMVFYHKDKLINNSLKDYFIKRYHNFVSSGIYNLNFDPFVDEIKELIINDIDSNIIIKSRHIELFYTYRNHLVHEFREPGDPLEMISESGLPFYHYMTNWDNKERKLELVYPLHFFISIVSNILINIKKYLINADLNPLSYFRFGSPWNSI